MKDSTQQAAEFLTKLVEEQGFAVSTVQDGHLILFKREKMRELIDRYPDEPFISIFLKQPTFGN